MKESGRTEQNKERERETRQMSFIYFARAIWEIREQLEYKGLKVGGSKRLEEQRRKKCRKDDDDWLKMDEVAAAQMSLLMHSD